MQKTIDLVLYGATGFTGELVAHYLANTAESRDGKLRWALAGRNRAKLEQVKARLVAQAPALAQLPLLNADSTDAASLEALAQKAKVIITTVGPYARYGEPLVKACAEVGADYVDLTGEPPFVEQMIERYHRTAEQRGAKIVHACGFDSIPHDMGAYFTLKALRARLSPLEREVGAITIEGFVRAKGDFSGGTWHSIIHAMANARADEAERKRLASQRGPQGPRRARKVPDSLRYRKELGLWGLPLATIDPQIVLRSARLLPEYGPDFRYGHYLGLRHLAQALGVAAGVGGVFALAQLKLTRQLLLKLRDPGQGPDEATRQKGWFSVTFLAQAGEQQVTCEVRGGDPGYGDTAKMLAESALCLAFDRDRLPAHAGIVTTAAGMGDPLIERLSRAGISFREK